MSKVSFLFFFLLCPTFTVQNIFPFTHNEMKCTKKISRQATVSKICKFTNSVPWRVYCGSVSIFEKEKHENANYN